MTTFTNAIITATRKAIPKLVMSKRLPINLSVITNVKAFMKRRKKPSVTSVIGRVRIIKMGRTSKFNIDRIKLASKAALNPAILKPEKYPEMAMNNTALIRILNNHLIVISLHLE
jgi:hypothetical protein